MKRTFVFVEAFIVVTFFSASATIIAVPDDYATIQQGINASSNGDTVLVQPDTYVENINFFNHSIVLGSHFLTTGDTSYIAATIIDGDSSGSVITIEQSEDSTTAIIGFTVQNGYATNGGGIYFHASGITLSNLIIKNNSASDFAGIGGGVYIYPDFASQNIEINSCAFIDNFAYYGGGLAFQRVRNGALVDNCYFDNNRTQTSGEGGAITFHGGSGQQSVNCTITNSVFTNNLSSYGGAIRIGNGRNIGIKFCRITGNTGSNASGISISENQSDSLVISNCTLSGNHSYGNTAITVMAI